jgi:hypothetical protein
MSSKLHLSSERSTAREPLVRAVMLAPRPPTARRTGRRSNLWDKTLPASLSPWTVLVYAFVTGALFWLPIAPPWWLLLGSHPAWVWLGVGIVTVFGTRESARPT